MQTEPYPQKDGLRCWLSRPEQTALVEHYDDEPEKQLAVSLCLHGLRSDEVRRVEDAHARTRDTADSMTHSLVIPESKTGHRETPLTADCRRLMQIYEGARPESGGPLVDRSRRSIRRWIGAAAEAVLDDDDAARVSPHDARRTWATDCYWSLAVAGYDAEIVVMNWGGWSSRETFRTNYLGRVPDAVAAEMQQTAGLE
jgi:integrase